MNVKLAAVNAHKFVKKFGMTCGASGTKGLVRLADGTVEEQYHSWSRRGKKVTHRRVVGKDEMAGFTAVAYLEDHFVEPVRGRTQFLVYVDDYQFRPVAPNAQQRRNISEFLLGYKGSDFLTEGRVDPSVKPPADLRFLLGYANAQSVRDQDGPVHEPGRAPTEYQRPA